MEDQRPVILVAEDEPITRRLYVDSLAESGFQVLEAKDGKKALKVALDSHPDLILLDIKMPKMDGLQVMEELRKHVWGSKVPIIILSNIKPDSEIIAQAIAKHEPSYYIEKVDLVMENLILQIRDTLKQRGNVTRYTQS